MAKKQITPQKPAVVKTESRKSLAPMWKPSDKNIKTDIVLVVW